MIDTERYINGLTDQEVLESRRVHGVNLLTPPKRPSMWKLYLEKFQDPVIQILLVAACLSLVISFIENEYAETIGIEIRCGSDESDHASDSNSQQL